jgi:catechol 2,3-dioxygenase-like lactoylglutathione lyase family enzyme
MLANHPIDPMILATDLAVAREFYGDRIGLEVVLESDDFVTLPSQPGPGAAAAVQDGTAHLGHVFPLR